MGGRKAERELDSGRDGEGGKMSKSDIHRNQRARRKDARQKCEVALTCLIVQQRCVSRVQIWRFRLSDKQVKVQSLVIKSISRDLISHTSSLFGLPLDS